MRRVRAAADLLGEIAHAVDFHDVAVLVAEEADGSFRAGSVGGHLAADDREIGLDLLVHDAFDLGELFGGHLFGVADIYNNLGTSLIYKSNILPSGWVKVSHCRLYTT